MNVRLKSTLGAVSVAFLVVLLFVGCNTDDSSVSPTEQVVIKVGDTINKVREVYGNPALAMNFEYEANGHFSSGLIWAYDNPDLTFYFDNSSPRKVTRIIGEQGD